jgi:DNA-binding response OmpR family regulator
MLNKGIVLTYEQISIRIWNYEYDGSGYGAIKNLVQRLRSKIALADNGDIVIQNMRGAGYCLPTHE